MNLFMVDFREEPEFKSFEEEADYQRTYLIQKYIGLPNTIEIKKSLQRDVEQISNKLLEKWGKQV